MGLQKIFVKAGEFIPTLPAFLLKQIIYKRPIGNLFYARSPSKELVIVRLLSSSLQESTMREPKLIHFLKLLPKKDLKSFSLYLSSPLFNQRNGLKKLYDILANHYLKPETTFSLKKLYAQAYQDRAYNEKSLKTSMSQLLSLLMDFLALSKFQEDQVIQKRFLLQKLNDLDESKYFPSFYNKATESLSKQSLTSSDFHYEMTLLEEELDLARSRLPKRDPQALMHVALQHLGNSFLIRLIRYKIRIVNREATYRPSSEYALMDTCLQHIENTLDNLPLVIQTYFQFYQAITSPEKVEEYQKAIKMLSQAVIWLPKIEAEELYTSALNFAVRQTNHGQVFFLNEIFSLYQDMLHHKIILDKGRLSPWHFKNIVNTALRLKKFDWANDFILQWQDLIFPDYAQNAFHYNQAILFFHQKEYAKAERHFHTLLEDFKDVFYGLNARGYLLQTYFETGNMMGLESMAHSFRMFLKRNKEISEEKKRMYLKFINHLTQLVKIPPRKHEKLMRLYQNLKEEPKKGMGSAWLMTKVAEIMKAPDLLPKNQFTQASSAIPKD